MALILVTVGSSVPFDRLVRCVDDWAGRTGRHEVFGQIGDTKYAPLHMTWKKTLPFTEFHGLMEKSQLIVGHAGIGTIVSALELGKPLIVMPRRAALGEQRNDHQLGTVARLARTAGISVAMDEKELAARLEDLDHLPCGAPVPPLASDELITCIRTFIEGGGGG